MTYYPFYLVIAIKRKAPLEVAAVTLIKGEGCKLFYSLNEIEKWYDRTEQELEQLMINDEDKSKLLQEIAEASNKQIDREKFVQFKRRYK